MTRFLGALMAAVCVMTAAGAGAQSEQALLVSTPTDFTMAWQHVKPDGSLKMMEFVPRGQTVENWQQMITVQHFPKLAPVDPQLIMGRWTQSVLGACPKAQISRVPQAPVDRHSAMRVYVHVTECGARAPESILAMTIKGADSMHMVQHAWRPQPPTRAQFQAAMETLDRVRLCKAGETACAK